MRRDLYRVAYSWCHDTHFAEDLTQETIAKALRSVGQLKEDNALEGWVFTIMTNIWRDHFRQQRNMMDIEDMVDLPSEEASPEEHYAENDLVRRVRAAIAKLPPNQRQVLTLVDLEEFSYAEAAETLGIPVGTVMSRLCRARQALRDQLQAPLLTVIHGARRKP